MLSLRQEADILRKERNDNASAMKVTWVDARVAPWHLCVDLVHIPQGKLEPERRAELIEQGKRLKDRVAEVESRLTALEEELQSEGQKLPNLTHPVGPGRARP